MPDFPEGHPNRRLHGHSYFVTVTLRSDEDVEVVEDYDDFKNTLQTVLREFDHTSANDWLGTAKPTMENICRFLWPRIKTKLPLLSRLELERPTLGMIVRFEGKNQ